jgi:hypothetical protein
MRNEKLHNLYFISDIVRMIKSSGIMDCEGVIYKGWIQSSGNTAVT